jgi:hypothetical protein
VKNSKRPGALTAEDRTFHMAVDLARELAARAYAQQFRVSVPEDGTPPIARYRAFNDLPAAS